MQDDWQELEAFCRELEEGGGAQSAAQGDLAARLEAFAPVLDLLERQEGELDVLEALARVRRRLLRGAGVIQQTWLDHGLERFTLLAWPAGADPRPNLAAARGEYRVEVLLGLSEQGRPRVRIVGAKRLEAVLPVTRAKFLDVLLQAVRAPTFVPVPDAASEGESAGDEPPAAAPTEAADAPPAPPDEAPADAGTIDGGSVAPPPAGDAPIPMGPATVTDVEDTPASEHDAAAPGEPRKRRGRTARGAGVDRDDTMPSSGAPA